MCIRLYMYISLKIDKSQWCKKTYQVVAYSLIKKVSLQRNIDIKHVKSTILVYIQMHTKPHTRARTQLVYTSYIQDDQGHLLLCCCLKSS